MKIKPTLVMVLKFAIGMVVGELLGASVGLLFDLLYIRLLKLYEVPVGAVVTIGFAVGYLFGWLGGLISHALLGDYGATGGIAVGFLGATIPLILSILSIFKKVRDLFSTQA